MNTANLMIMNVCMDEDGFILPIEKCKLDEFKYKGFISSNGMAGLEDHFDTDNFNFDFSYDPTQETTLLNQMKELEDFVGKLEDEAGSWILVSWSVEYDNNWCVIWNTTGPIDYLAWFNRIVDESEFDLLDN